MNFSNLKALDSWYRRAAGAEEREHQSIEAECKLHQDWDGLEAESLRFEEAMKQLELEYHRYRSNLK